MFDISPIDKEIERERVRRRNKQTTEEHKCLERGTERRYS